MDLEVFNQKILGRIKMLTIGGADCMIEEKEKNLYKEIDPDLRDWEYDAEGIKRHKKAFHLKWTDEKNVNDEHK